MALQNNEENIRKANLQLKKILVLQKKVEQYRVEAYGKFYAFGKYSSVS